MTVTMRSMFFHQIQGLRDDVVTLASMVDQGIARVSEAPRSQDMTLAKQLIADNQLINEYRSLTASTSSHAYCRRGCGRED